MKEVTEADVVTRYIGIWKGLRPDQRTDQKWQDLLTCCRWDIDQMDAVERTETAVPFGPWQDNPISRSWIRRWLHI